MIRLCGTKVSYQLVVLVWASAVACQGPTERAGLELAQRGDGLAGAHIDRSHRGVLAVVSVTPETVELCTGTLIAPNLLLTARHCISDTSLNSLSCASTPAFFGEPRETRSLWVNHADALSGPIQSFGLLPVTGGGDEFVPVTAVRVPDTDVVCGGDVALLILDGSIAADSAEPLAPRLDEPVTTGEAYTAVGFGDTLDGGALGTRRAREGLEARCGGDDCRSRANLASNEFQGGDGVCSGDSGGPALNADGRVIGIASRSTDCANSVYSAVSNWRDWIRGVAQEALLLGAYPAPAWLVASPADAGVVAPTPVTSSDGGLTDQPMLDPEAPADPLDLPQPPDSNADAPVPGNPVNAASHNSGCGLSPSARERPAEPGLLHPLGLAALIALRRRLSKRFD
jgi:Trypsin-like peptidase domain